MNIRPLVARRRSLRVPRGSGNAEPQLSLPLDPDSGDEDALRLAWARSGLAMPYHVALRHRPLAICLCCLADAMRRKAGIDARRSDAKHASHMGSKGKHGWTN